MFWLTLVIPIFIMGGLITYGGRKMTGELAKARARRTAEGARGKGPARPEQAAPPPARNVAVTDLSGQLSEALEHVFEQHNASNPNRRINLTEHTVEDDGLADLTDGLAEDIRGGTLDAHLVLAKDVLEEDGKCFLYTKNANDRDLFPAIRRLVNEAVAYRRMRVHGLRPELIAELHSNISLEQVGVGSEVETKSPDAGVPGKFLGMMGAFFFLFLMFMAIVSTGQMLLTSLIEEKSSRVIEVLLSAVSPLQLMGGKILGLAGVGFTFAIACGGTIWTAAAFAGLPSPMSVFGVGWFFIYFVLGFLLMSSVYAAVGSACNTLKEAQTMMFPVMLIYLLPMMAWMYFAQNPDGWPAIALSLFPPTAPMLMILRIAVCPDLPLLQILASILLLAASVPAAIWAAAKVFRTGVLMHGKPPKLRELVRWVRYK